MKIAEWFKLPQVKGIEEIDASSVALLHKDIIQRKRFLKRLYTDWYSEFKKVADNSGVGLLVELGSGGGFLKEVIPAVITSDIVFLPGIDINFSVFNMPFKNNSVRAFFVLDVFHHINDSSIFLKELSRCLIPGGKIIMIEPANTLWGSFIWRNFHHEMFDTSCGWESERAGRLSSANSAIPWIIFFRDRERFRKEFPSLSIKRCRFHTPFRYLVSGGVSMRQLLPSFAYSLIKGIEFILAPSNRYVGMFMTIEIEKIK